MDIVVLGFLRCGETDSGWCNIGVVMVMLELGFEVWDVIDVCS